MYCICLCLSPSSWWSHCQPICSVHHWWTGVGEMWKATKIAALKLPGRWTTTPNSVNNVSTALACTHHEPVHSTSLGWFCHNSFPFHLIVFIFFFCYFILTAGLILAITTGSWPTIPSTSRTCQELLQRNQTRVSKN